MRMSREAGKQAKPGSGEGRGLGSGRCPRRCRGFVKGKDCVFIPGAGRSHRSAPFLLFCFCFSFFGRNWWYDQLHNVKCESYLESEIDKTRCWMGEGSRLQAQRKGGSS